MKTYVTVYFGTLLLAMLLVPIISRLAKWYRLVDTPGPRKVHKVSIPRIGGIAFVISTLALVLGVFFLSNDIGESFRESCTEYIALLAGAVFMFAVGLFDDLHPVRGYIKLLCLIAASLAICASGATISSISLGTSFEFETGLAAWPLTILWIVMITVCMSVIDGLDGLAAGVAAIVCGTMVLIALWSGQAAMAILMLALLGSVTGFLIFNFYPAKIFMGDCGSMFLGFMIGAGSIVCQTKTSTLIGLAIPFLVLVIPVFDTGFVVICRRILDRRSVFAPDRSHLHHRLLDLGLRQITVVIIIYAVTAISASIGVLIITVQGGWSFVLLACGVLLMLSMFACLQCSYFRKILKALKRNRTIARKVKAERRIFETTQVKMRESKSFGAWWDTLCTMGKEMRFQSIGLWNRRNGRYVRKYLWNAPEGKSMSGNTINLRLPLNRNGEAECEIRTCILADGYLEQGGRQAMLLSRLMDEFPPPEQEKEAEKLDLFSYTKRRPKIEEKVRDLTNTETLKKPVQIPTSIDVMGIPVVPFESYDQALECIEGIIESNLKSRWIAINPIKIYNAWHKPELLNILQQTDAGICDGVGVSITSKILYGRNIKRCTGCDLFFKLLSLASQKNWGVYLLGASAESNAAARSKLQKMYPDLRIVGWQDGYFEDSQKVIEHINSSKAKLLFVAMGSPKQENWIQNNWQAINANICMGVGGSFDIASGTLKRAPKVFRMTGTEFLYRLICEPGKRWPIQKVLLPYFLQVIGKKAVNLTLSDEGQTD
ncbi:MAG: WecB/TagA/CpsF family glycosyltransferase [Sedimentisphaerales bacterium]|nr:WecB/TagA/CpsF family glycosyltransferase [Sedimentisphaerales bacterium]